MQITSKYMQRCLTSLVVSTSELYSASFYPLVETLKGWEWAVMEHLLENWKSHMSLGESELLKLWESKLDILLNFIFILFKNF